MEVELDLWSSRSSNPSVDHILSDVDCCDIADMDEFILGYSSGTPDISSQHQQEDNHNHNHNNQDQAQGQQLVSDSHHHQHQHLHPDLIHNVDINQPAASLSQHFAPVCQQQQQQSRTRQLPADEQFGQHSFHQSQLSFFTDEQQASQSARADTFQLQRTFEQQQQQQDQAADQTAPVAGHCFLFSNQVGATPTSSSMQSGCPSTTTMNSSSTTNVAGQLEAANSNKLLQLNQLRQMLNESSSFMQQARNSTSESACNSTTSSAAAGQQLAQVSVSSSTGSSILDRHQMQLLLDSQPQPISCSPSEPPATQAAAAQPQESTAKPKAKRARNQPAAGQKRAKQQQQSITSSTAPLKGQEATSNGAKKSDTKADGKQPKSGLVVSSTGDNASKHRRSAAGPGKRRTSKSAAELSGYTSPTLSSSSGVSSLSCVHSSDSGDALESAPNSNGSCALSSSSKRTPAKPRNRRPKKQETEQKQQQQPAEAKERVMMISCSSLPWRSAGAGADPKKESALEEPANEMIERPPSSQADGKDSQSKPADEPSKETQIITSNLTNGQIKLEPTLASCNQTTFSLTNVLAQSSSSLISSTSQRSSSSTSANKQLQNQTTGNQLGFSRANLSPSSRQKLNSLSSCLIINSSPSLATPTTSNPTSSSANGGQQKPPLACSSADTTHHQMAPQASDLLAATTTSTSSTTTTGSTSSSSAADQKGVQSPARSRSSASSLSFCSSDTTNPTLSFASSSSPSCSPSSCCSSSSPSSSVSSSPTMQLGLCAPSLVPSSAVSPSATTTSTVVSSCSSSSSSSSSSSLSSASSSGAPQFSSSGSSSCSSSSSLSLVSGYGHVPPAALISTQDWKSAQNGQQVLLTDEERRTLIAEGYPIPQRFPLSKAEERSLKKIRRKIKNKISAQESRRKKKEYMEELEKKVQAMELRIIELERENRAMRQQQQQQAASQRSPATSKQQAADGVQPHQRSLASIQSNERAHESAGPHQRDAGGRQLAAAPSSALVSNEQQAREASAELRQRAHDSDQCNPTSSSSSSSSSSSAAAATAVPVPPQHQQAAATNNPNEDDEHFIDDILMSQEQQESDGQLECPVGDDLVANLVDVVCVEGDDLAAAETPPMSRRQQAAGSEQQAAAAAHRSAL